MGVIFQGSEGWVNLEGATHPSELRGSAIGPNEIQLYKCSSQYGNFVECVKTRAETSAPIEVAHRSISVSHLGNIAMKLGRPLEWNPDKERFINDPEADRLIGRPMREPWRL